VLLASHGAAVRLQGCIDESREFPACRPAITGDAPAIIVHSERDAPDGARFLHSDVKGEPPGRVTVHYGLLDGTRC
jgi:hypothetical protein